MGIRSWRTLTDMRQKGTDCRRTRNAPSIRKPGSLYWLGLAVALTGGLLALLAACDQDRVRTGLAQVRRPLSRATAHSIHRSVLDTPSALSAGRGDSGMLVYAVAVVLIVVAVALGALLLRHGDREHR